jgi:hypothetical protein
MLDRALAIALDASRLLVEVGMKPDPWQRDTMTSKASQSLLLCTRQGGKSTTAAARAVWEAICAPPAEVIMLSASQRQASELFRKALEVWRQFEALAPADAETTLKLELHNGSRIMSLPSSEGTIRGYSAVRLVIVDEAARVPDDLYLAVRPMLATSGGRLIAMSTPYGRRGWFHEAWQLGGDAWARTKITAYDCPRISSEFLAQEKAAMPARWFAQEYMCEFAETEDNVFDYDLVSRALSDDVSPLDLSGPA